MLRLIPTKAHGVLDYLMSMVLIAAPWLFGFARGGAETWVPVALGLGAAGYSLCARYECGLLPLIPMPAHLNGRGGTPAGLLRRGSRPCTMSSSWAGGRRG